MRTYTDETRLPGVVSEHIEAAMKRAHRLRSEALRGLGARFVGALGDRRRGLPAAIRGGPVGLLAGGNATGEPDCAPTRGEIAPQWRAALRTRGWVNTARCDGT